MYERTKIKIRPPRFPGPDQWKILLPCLARFGCAFLFTGATLQETYLPLGLCLLTVPDPGLYGFSALLGVCSAALLLWNTVTAAELIAAAILIRTAVWIFRDSAPAAHPLFLPAAAAAITAMVGGVMLFSEQSHSPSILLYLLRVCLSFAGSVALRGIVRKPTRESVLFLIACLILSAHAIRPLHISLGVLLAVLMTVCTAGNPSGLALAAVCGITLDCTGGLGLPMTAILALASLLSVLTEPHSQILSRSAAPITVLVGVLFFSAEAPHVFWAALLGTIPAVFLPGGMMQNLPPAEKRPSPPVLHMLQASQLLTDLNSRLLRESPEPMAADPSVIFDRAADRVCKSCPQFQACWSGKCEAYDALSGAARPMISRGAVLRDDFPVSFLSRCRRIEQLLTAINQELDSVLFRRQFRHRLNESRSLMAEQYRIFSAYLQSTVHALSSPPRIRPICLPVLGAATAERRGCMICGDRGASFRTKRHLHYILLCDGMGSGFEAMEESTASIHLIQDLLISGFAPDDALQLLNSVYLMRDDGAFSTVDLLQADLSTGELILWKWGSAPSYIKQGSVLKKIGTALPPPGLEGTGRAERFKLSLGAGDLLVLLSDGAVGAGTEEQIRSYSGTSPKELAAKIIDQCAGEDDDRTAVVLKLQYIASQRQSTTNCV